jgi:hypothetical protein
MLAHQRQQRPAENHCNRLIFNAFSARHAACCLNLEQDHDLAMVLMIASDTVNFSTIL